MGKGTEICKIINGRKEPLFLVNILAEIHPFLKAYGVGLQKGIVIFSENSDCFYDIQQYLQQTGAAPCKNLTAPKRRILNNAIGLHAYDNYDKEAESMKFLSEDEFTPAILIHSVIPDFLRECENLIVISENMEFKSITIEIFKEFRNYIHRNPEFIENSIRIFKGSELYLEHRWKGRLDLALQTSAEVFCNYYRQKHTETETNEIRVQMHDLLELLNEQAECCSGEWDNLDTVRTVVFNYLDRNPEILIGDKNRIEGPLVEALQQDMAVLWDDTAYYFTEKLFKRACEPLSGMVSFTEIKRELKEEGFLHSNRTADGNFTVKKVVTNAFGYKMRLRFLRITRDFFDWEGELTLAERGKKSCTLELPMENPAE